MNDNSPIANNAIHRFNFVCFSYKITLLNCNLYYFLSLFIYIDAKHKKVDPKHKLIMPLLLSVVSLIKQKIAHI